MESPTTTLAAAQLASAAPARTHDPHRAPTRSPRRGPRARRTAIAVICAIAAVALASLALSSGAALAAAGDLDPTFDGDGKRVLPLTCLAYDVLPMITPMPHAVSDSALSSRRSWCSGASVSATDCSMLFVRKTDLDAGPSALDTSEAISSGGATKA